MESYTQVLVMIYACFIVLQINQLMHSLYLLKSEAASIKVQRRIRSEQKS